MRVSVHISFFSVFLVLSSFRIEGQTNNYSLKLAEAYEKDGQFEDAVEIYEHLMLTDSLDSRIISGLKNGYKILGRHDQRIGLIRKQLQRDSSDILLLGEMIDALYRKKDLVRARYFLSQALTEKNRTLEKFQFMGRLLFEMRWYEESLKVYRLARQTLKNEKLFILETAGILLFQEQYLSASKEYLKHYQINPEQWPFVKNQLLLFPDDTSSNRQVIQSLQDHLQSQPGDLAVSRFLLDFFIRGKLYDQAFKLAIILDKKEKQNGISILNFANAMTEQGQFSIGINAYTYFLDLYPEAPQAKTGLARCYSAKADSIHGSRNLPDQDSVHALKSSKLTEQALLLYDDIIDRFPDTDWAAESFYQSGLIFLNRYHDYDKALSSFHALQHKYPRSIFYPLAKIQAIECLIRQNKIAEAMKLCSEEKIQVRDPLLRDQILFITAELYMYDSQMDTALSQFQKISEKQQGFYVNDALQNIMLIQQGTGSPEILKQFIHSRLLQRQYRHNEAAELLLSLSHRPGPLSDFIFFQTAEVYMDMNKNREALQWLQEGIDRFPESPLQDLSLKTMGDLYAGLQEVNKAIAVYKQLIVKYPKSIYISDARKQIRHLETKLKKSS